MSDDKHCACETREEFYEEHISPLVAEILEMCKQAKIPLVCAFGIPDADAPEKLVTTASFGGELPRNDNIVIAYHVLTNDSSPMLQQATRRLES